jgi:hypothetical protein
MKVFFDKKLFSSHLLKFARTFAIMKKILSKSPFQSVYIMKGL